MKKIIIVIGTVFIFTGVAYATTPPFSVQCPFTAEVLSFQDVSPSGYKPLGHIQMTLRLLTVSNPSTQRTVPSCESFGDTTQTGTWNTLISSYSYADSVVDEKKIKAGVLSKGVIIKGEIDTYGFGITRVDLVGRSHVVTSTPPAPSTLIEDKTYTVKELNTNTSTISRKFFTEAYVVYVFVELPCPIGKEVACVPPRPSYIVISDKNTQRSDETNLSIEDTILYSGNRYAGENEINFSFFKVAKKYKLEVQVTNTSKNNVPNNRFTLVSVKDIGEKSLKVNGQDEKTLATSTSTVPTTTVVSQPPAKKSFVARLRGWFAGLFR